MKITTDFLQQFCDNRPESEASKFIAPWNDGDFTYASDLVVVIRVNRMEEILPWTHAKEPDADIIKTYVIGPTTSALLELPYEVRPINKCSCGCEHYCNPKRDAPVFIRMGIHKTKLYYVWLIKKLPNLKVYQGSSKQEMLGFTFDGGIGNLMPLRDTDNSWTEFQPRTITTHYRLVDSATHDYEPYQRSFNLGPEQQEPPAWEGEYSQ